MSTYYLAPCLVQLRSEVNVLWPNRDKASDGWIGDTAHSARVSDHNPDWDHGGVVRAVDLDKDGIDVPRVVAAAQADPRTRYIIWQRRIWTKATGWRAYTGSNPHDKHVHISVQSGAALENDRRPWLVDPVTVSHTTPIPGADIPNPITALPATIEQDWLMGYTPQDVARATLEQPIALTGEDVAGTLAGIRRDVQAMSDLLTATRADVQRSDAVDRGQLTGIESVLTSLSAGAAVTPADLAAAIPDNLAAQVADELAKRLTNGA